MGSTFIRKCRLGQSDATYGRRRRATGQWRSDQECTLPEEVVQLAQRSNAQPPQKPTHQGLTGCIAALPPIAYDAEAVNASKMVGCVTVLCLATTLAACSRSLVVEGDRPYTRCLDADAPQRDEVRVESIRVRREGRNLSLSGLREGAHVGFLSGPISRDLPTKLAKKADVLVVVGDTGRQARDVKESISNLAAARRLTLILAGGADRMDWIDDAIAGLPRQDRGRVIHITPYRLLVTPTISFGLLGGSLDGAYSRSRAYCGAPPSRASEIIQELSARHGRKGWIAWQMPSYRWLSPLVSRVIPQAEPPSKLAEVAIHAWPYETAGSVTTTSARKVAPRCTTAVTPSLSFPHTRWDGSLARPGFLLLNLTTLAFSPSLPPLAHRAH